MQHRPLSALHMALFTLQSTVSRLTSITPMAINSHFVYYMALFTLYRANFTLKVPYQDTLAPPP